MDPINFINTGIVADQNKEFFDNFYGIPQNLQFNNTVAPVPLASASTMFQDLYYPNLGIMNQAPIDFGRFEGITEETDIDDDTQDKVEKTRTGIETLLGFLQNIPTPINLITGRLEGIRNLNQRLRATDFGRSKTLAEFLDRRARAKEASRRAESFADFAERTAGTEATGGAGDFSTPAGLDTSYEEASRSFGRDR